MRQKERERKRMRENERNMKESYRGKDTERKKM